MTSWQLCHLAKDINRRFTRLAYFSLFTERTFSRLLYFIKLVSLVTPDTDWIETHREAHRLLSLELPLQKDVLNQSINQTEGCREPRELQQGPEESIAIYYRRVQNMMTQVDVRDRPTSSEDEELGYAISDMNNITSVQSTPDSLIIPMYTALRGWIWSGENSMHFY